jgi:hypothetical protein
MTVPVEPVAAGGGGPGDRPQPGELNIKQRRSWKTWQLLTAVIVAAVLGMWINGDTGGGGGAAGAHGTTSGTLPPAATPQGDTTPGGGVTTTTTAAAAGGGSAGGGATTTTAAGGTTTTVAGGSATTPTSSPAAAGPARVLLTSPQLKGNWTSTSFTTTAAPWNIGWAFACTPAPAGGPSFQVFVVPAGGSPSGTAAVSETGAQGQSVTPQTTTGAQTLVIQTTSSCTWIVKVTGS